MKDKNFNKWAGYVIGLVWCVGMVYGLYFYYTAVMGFALLNLPLWLANNIYIFVALFGILFFVLYERYVHFSRIVIDKQLGRIIKK